MDRTQFPGPSSSVSSVDKGNAIMAAYIALLGVVTVALSVYFGSWSDTWPLLFLVLGGALGWTRLTSNNKLSYLVMPFLCMVCVGLHINAARGLPETHFAVFVSIAAVVVYRHYLPLLAAAGTIAVHHIVVNEMQLAGLPVFCFPDPNRVRVVMHAAYVVVETAILLFITRSAASAYLAGEETVALFNHVNRRMGKFDLDVSRFPAQSVVADSGKQCLVSLHETIGEIDAALKGVMSFSSDISKGNSSLADRTTYQQGILENAEASVDKIAEQATHNNAEAGQARETFDDILQAIHENAKQLSELENTMRDVSKFSLDIEQVVNTINGFAFQTNILALNAAVEAARAGEQGRGFAVVASEVRSLAQNVNRSATEIGVIIEKSSAAVAQGERLALDSSTRMRQMVTSTKSLSNVSTDIQESTQRQLVDTEAVQDLIKNIADDTRHNAGMTETTSKLTAELDSALRDLKSQLNLFNRAA